MTIVDKRTTTANKEFDELPISAVFEFPAGKYAECYGICMKIRPADYYENTIDLENHCILTVEADTKVCELSAHLVIERN